MYGYELGAEAGDDAFSTLDNADDMPKSQVVDDHFDWGDDRPPRTPIQPSHPPYACRACRGRVCGRREADGEGVAGRQPVAVRPRRSCARPRTDVA